MRTDCYTPDQHGSSLSPTRRREAVHRWGIWRFLCLLSLVLVTGCAARSSPMSATDTEAVSAAYRAGLQTALRGYQEEMLDHDFPYTNWNPPLVQRLWIPARITGGVFIAGHMEDVIVKPGAWKREFSAPLSTHQSASQTRLYTHDRPIGSADRPRDAAEADAVPSPSRVPLVPRHSTRPTPSTGSAWAELPTPGAKWGVTP